MGLDDDGLLAAWVEFGTGERAMVDRWNFHGRVWGCWMLKEELYALGTLCRLQTWLPTSCPLTYLACALAGLITRLESMRRL